MSITLTTLKSEDDERDNIEVEIEEFEENLVFLGQDGALGPKDWVSLTRGQLQQLMAWAIKERWIDSIPM